MGRRRKERSILKHHFKAIANHYLQKMQQGENITILSILEELLNALMIAERDIYLSLSTDNRDNGFINGALKLTMENLDLKVPRVRFGNSFRPIYSLRNGKGWIEIMKTSYLLSLRMVIQGEGSRLHWKNSTYHTVRDWWRNL